MKCELCHQKDAETAIQLARDGGESEELYVCRECANRGEVDYASDAWRDCVAWASR